MKEWKDDKKWSDVFIPEIKQILGLYLIGEPPEEEDQKRNTDLIVLKLNSVRIACRIRKFEYYERYPYEFTIREGRPSGIKTELAKVIEGWGDYMFYGFCDKDEKSLVSWEIINLNSFRLWFTQQLAKNKGVVPGTGKQNTDNSSNFRAFNIREMPTTIIFASSHH